jgi:hypothetical protein
VHIARALTGLLRLHILIAIYFVIERRKIRDMDNAQLEQLRNQAVEQLNRIHQAAQAHLKAQVDLEQAFNEMAKIRIKASGSANDLAVSLGAVMSW